MLMMSLHFIITQTTTFGREQVYNFSNDPEKLTDASKHLTNNQTKEITFYGRLVHYYSDLEGITHLLCDNYFQNETCIRLEIGTSGMTIETGNGQLIPGTYESYGTNTVENITTYSFQ
jgi:hypothetical protein